MVALKRRTCLNKRVGDVACLEREVSSTKLIAGIPGDLTSLITMPERSRENLSQLSGWDGRRCVWRPSEKDISKVEDDGSRASLKRIHVSLMVLLNRTDLQRDISLSYIYQIGTMPPERYCGIEHDCGIVQMRDS